MKKYMVPLLALMFILHGSIATMARGENDGETRVGLGFSLGSSSSITLPILFSESFLLEPYFSYYKRNSDGINEDILGAGIGIFGRDSGEVTGFYYGTRLGGVLNNGDGATESGIFQLSLVFAPEYRINKAFTISGEALLSYMVTRYADTQPDQTIITTSSNLLLRMYF